MSKRQETGSTGGGKYQSLGTPASGVHGAEAIGELPLSVLPDCLTSVLSAGDAIQFSVTRDGGAVVITMYSESGVDKLYCGSVDELQSTLEGIQSASEAFAAR